MHPFAAEPPEPEERAGGAFDRTSRLLLWLALTLPVIVSIGEFFALRDAVYEGFSGAVKFGRALETIIPVTGLSGLLVAAVVLLQRLDAGGHGDD